jgi:hypothetical protein
VENQERDGMKKLWKQNRIKPSPQLVIMMTREAVEIIIAALSVKFYTYNVINKVYLQVKV